MDEYIDGITEFNIQLAKGLKKKEEEIAEELNIPEDSLKKISKKIKKNMYEFVDSLIAGCGHQAVENYQRWVSLGRDWDNLSVVDKSICHRASKEILDAIGLVGKQMSEQIKTVINVQQNSISPVIKELLEKEKIRLMEDGEE